MSVKISTQHKEQQLTDVSPQHCLNLLLLKLSLYDELVVTIHRTTAFK